MTRTILVTAAVLLAGCAVNRTDTVHLSLYSAKDPADVTECIQAQWMENPAGLPAVRFARGDGYSVTLHGESNETVLIADATPNGNGSDVIVRRAWWNESIAEQVRNCI